MNTDDAIRYHFTGERPELLEQARVGEHVWIAAAAFRLQPETLRGRGTGQLNLDRENLASVTVRCYLCEQPWSDRISYRGCPGHPVGEV